MNMKLKRILQDKVVLLIILLSIIVIAIVFVILRVNVKTSQRGTPSQQEPTMTAEMEIQKKEKEAFSAVDEVVTTYLNKEYPAANDISIRQEYVGSGYGIIDASFTTGSQENIRKIYLAFDNSTWRVIHESEDTITCDEVSRLIDTDSVLTHFCE